MPETPRPAEESPTESTLPGQSLSDRTGSPPADQPPHARTLGGRYRLDRVIGRGAMGTVWAAFDEVLQRAVAIKEVDFPAGMPSHEVAALADRTLREARAIAALSNPHVITLFDILTLPSGPVIVMELLQARSLAQVLRHDGPLAAGQAATVGVAVAGGLLAAHSAGITHRDVKPGNVLVGRDGRIKLTDFGIARSAQEQTMTATGLLLGSPAYIAPEVAAGRPATTQADAWGLGALLFAAVQGKPPYDKGDPIATLTSVVMDPVPAHPQSGRLGPVIDGLLVKDPRGRLPVAQALHMLQGLADDPTGMRLAAIGLGAPPAAPMPDRHADVVAAAPIFQPSTPALPPPPWEQDQARSLAALPAEAERTSRRGLTIAAILVGLAAAAAGYFGVRAIADLSAAQPAATAAVATSPVAGPASY